MYRIAWWHKTLQTVGHGPWMYSKKDVLMIVRYMNKTFPDKFHFIQ